MTGRAWRAATDESAATAVEYAVMVALVAVVIIGGVSALGASVSSVFAGVDLDAPAENAEVPSIVVAEVDTETAEPAGDAGEAEEEQVPEAGNSGNLHPQGGSQGNGEGGPPDGVGGGAPVEPPGGGRDRRP